MYIVTYSGRQYTFTQWLLLHHCPGHQLEAVLLCCDIACDTLSARQAKLHSFVRGVVLGPAAQSRVLVTNQAHTSYLLEHANPMSQRTEDYV